MTGEDVLYLQREKSHYGNRAMDLETWEREKEEGTQKEGDVEATQPLGEITRFVDYGEDGELVPRRKMSIVAAAEIDLLLQFLTQHIQRCGDIVD